MQQMESSAFRENKQFSLKHLIKSGTVMTGLHEERVFYAQQFLNETFDLRSQILFWRFDACVFVNCKILMDSFTQQLAFTRCIFEDCNIDQLIADEERALIAYDNIFEQPIANRKADFERRLAKALARRKAPCDPGCSAAGFRPEHVRRASYP